MKLWDVMESPVQDVGDLRRRTTILAVIHVVLATACLALLALLVLRIKLLVTLAQRSNVETLLLLFFAAFVTVLLITTGASTLGAITLLGLRVLPADLCFKSTLCLHRGGADRPTRQRLAILLA